MVRFLLTIVGLLTVAIPSIADDTTSLQKMLDDAGTGATVRLENKTYLVSKPIACRKAIHLEANGSTLRAVYPFRGTALTVGGQTGQRAEKGSIRGLTLEQWPPDYRVKNPEGTGLRIVNALGWRFTDVSVKGFGVGVHWDCDGQYSSACTWEGGILTFNRTTFLVTPRQGQWINGMRVVGGYWGVGSTLEGPATFIKLDSEDGGSRACAWWFQNVVMETSAGERCIWATVSGRGNTWRDCFTESLATNGKPADAPFVLKAGSLGNIWEGEFQDTLKWDDSGYKNRRFPSTLKP